MVVVVAIMVGLRVRRWKKGQSATDNAAHYYSTPEPDYDTVDGEGRKGTVVVDYYEDMGQGGGGGEGRKKESTAVDYYEDMGQGGRGGEGRKKESAAVDYYEDMERDGGGGKVVTNPGAAYQELQQSGLQEASYTHIYTTWEGEGALNAVEHPAGGTSGTDKQSAYDSPGGEPHYTALNMDTVSKSEYEKSHNK